MDKKEISKQVEAFVALPKAERKAKYFSLPKEVQLQARKVIEAQRGIAYRAQGGVLVLTEATYLAEIARVQARINDLPAKKTALEAKLVELKAALKDNHGVDYDAVPKK